MSLKKLLALLTLPLVSLFVIAGCASPAPSDNDKDDDRDSSKSDDEDSDDEDEDEDDQEVAAEGELAEPGTRVGADTWLTHSFTTVDDGEALISARLVSVEPVSADQLAFLNETFDGGELEGYDVWMIHVEEKKESGDTVEFNADYSFFDVVDEDGEQVQSLTVIGWDECDSASFEPEFDTAGTVITQCFLAAAKPGDPEPAGVAYVGGYEDDNPYSSYDGKPLYFIMD